MSRAAPYSPAPAAAAAAIATAAAVAQQQVEQQLEPRQWAAPQVLQPQGLTEAELACEVPVVAVGSVGDQYGDVLQHLLRLCRAADRWALLHT